MTLTPDQERRAMELWLDGGERRLICRELIYLRDECERLKMPTQDYLNETMPTPEPIPKETLSRLEELQQKIEEKQRALGQPPTPASVKLARIKEWAEQPDELETCCKMVTDAGLVTGHADTVVALMREVLWQAKELRVEVDRLKQCDPRDEFKRLHEQQWGPEHMTKEPPA